MRVTEAIRYNPLVQRFVGVTGDPSINMRDPQDYETYRPEVPFIPAAEVEQIVEEENAVLLAGGEILAIRRSRLGI